MLVVVVQSWCSAHQLNRYLLLLRLIVLQFDLRSYLFFVFLVFVHYQSRKQHTHTSIARLFANFIYFTCCYCCCCWGWSCLSSTAVFLITWALFLVPCTTLATSFSCHHCSPLFTVLGIICSSSGGHTSWSPLAGKIPAAAVAVVGRAINCAFPHCTSPLYPVFVAAALSFSFIYPFLRIFIILVTFSQCKGNWKFTFNSVVVLF